jgi:hypothetical protein
MQIGRLGELYTVNYVTGPSHVWLGLSLSQVPKLSPELVERPAIGECQHGKLDAGKVLEAVRDGIEEAGVGLFAERIEYVANDSPRYDLYRHCAMQLVKHAIHQGPINDSRPLYSL